jgi:hypothetical protein
MPYDSNGDVVGWKIKIAEFRKTIGDDDLSDEKKLLALAKIIDKHKETFSKEDDYNDFAEDLREVVECNSGTDDLEDEGNYVIGRIYDYADRHLIWLGI